MSHGPEHQIEHAEHAAHASHDAFNRVVTMSIAIVAAVLACVTMLGHRAHNDTLRLQGEALSLQTKASQKTTERANEWAYYQTKNIFNLLSEIELDNLSLLTVIGDTRNFDEIRKRHEDTVEYYSGSKDNRTTDRSKNRKKYEGKLTKIEEGAKKLAEEAKQLEDEADKRIEASHEMHARGERFDYGELGLQFGVVLCSLAILTKSRGFWFVGLLASAIGAAIAMTGQFGLFLGHH